MLTAAVSLSGISRILENAFYYFLLYIKYVRLALIILTNFYEKSSASYFLAEFMILFSLFAALLPRQRLLYRRHLR